jgi:hypothetical protein
MKRTTSCFACLPALHSRMFTAMHRVFISILMLVSANAHGGTGPDTTALCSDGTHDFRLHLRKESGYSEFSLRSVEVFRTGDANAVQEIRLEEEMIPNADSTFTSAFERLPVVKWTGTGRGFRSGQFIAEDMNFDGYNDLRICYQGEPYETDLYFHFWMFDPLKNRFQLDTLYEGIIAPNFVAESKTVFQVLFRQDTSYVVKWGASAGGLLPSGADTLPGIGAASLGNMAIIFYSGMDWTCSGTVKFETGDGSHYRHDYGLNPDSLTRFEVRPMFSYDKIKVYGRCKLAYGSRNSETEGICFYHSDSDRINGKRWYSYTRRTRMKEVRKNTFDFVMTYPNESRMDGYARPQAGFKTASDSIMKLSGWLLNMPSEEPYATEYKEFHSVHLYIYELEFEIIVYSKGKAVHKFVSIPLLHGEC